MDILGIPLTAVDQITVSLGGETRHTLRVGDKFARQYEHMRTIEITRIGKMGVTTFVSYVTYGPKGHEAAGGTVGVHEAAERIERGEWVRVA
jgi:hypothetical protein